MTVQDKYDNLIAILGVVAFWLFIGFVNWALW